MKRTRKILRRSIHIFLQDHRHFTSMCSFLALPFSVSVFLSLDLSTRLVLPNMYVCLKSLFDAAGFPAYSEFFKILNLKLSQTIASLFVTLPFSITFLLFVKSYVIASLNHDGTKPVFPVSFSSFATTYKSILATYVCNSLIILSANATAFSLLFLAFNCLKGVSTSNNTAKGNFEPFVSIAGAILYSIILAHALVVCNLALVLAGSKNIGGSVASLKACVMISSSTSTSLSLAVPINLAFAATEALFQFRVVRSYQKNDLPRFTAVMETLLIAYLYSMLIVLDTIVGCIFYRSCKEMNPLIVHHNEDRYYSQIETFDYHKCSIWNAEEGDIKDQNGIGSRLICLDDQGTSKTNGGF